MDGVKVFVDPETPDSPVNPESPVNHAVFYSCREGGPLYRWSFAEGPNRWRAKRLNSSELTTRELTLSKWNDVPPPLQRNMREHYQD